MMLMMLMATICDIMVMMSQGGWSHSKTAFKQARGLLTFNCEVLRDWQFQPLPILF
jgi:hypothetical protein